MGQGGDSANGLGLRGAYFPGTQPLGKSGRAFFVPQNFHLLLGEVPAGLGEGSIWSILGRSLAEDIQAG